MVGNQTQFKEVGMIIESVGIVAPGNRREELRRALAALVEPTQVEPGCVACQLYQETANASAFRFESQWKTQDDLIRRMRSEVYRSLLALMELSVEPPEIAFHMVTGTQGLEFVQAVRERRAERE